MKRIALSFIVFLISFFLLNVSAYAVSYLTDDFDDETLINSSNSNNHKVGGSFLSVDTTNEECSNWIEGWSYRKKIVIDKDAVAGASSKDVYYSMQIYVEISDQHIEENSQPDGDDIIFVGADCQQIPHEIQEYVYDAGAGASNVGVLKAWVRLPAVYNGYDTPFYIYYGNPTVDSQEDIYYTWNPYYDVVYHLEEQDGTTTVNDSSRREIDGTIINGAGSTITTDYGDGILGDAFLFNEDGEYVRVGNDGSLFKFYGSGAGHDGQFTVSYWFKYTSSNTTYHGNMFSTADVYEQAGFAIYENGSWVAFYNESGTACSILDTTLQANRGQWHYFTMTRENGLVYIYLDGNVLNPSGHLENANLDPGVQDEIALGKNIDPASGAEWWYRGYIDEFRIADSYRRPDGMIKTEFNNQSDPESFYDVSVDYVEEGDYSGNENIINAYVESVDYLGSTKNINFFKYNLSTYPENTFAKVQFSIDGTNWYNSKNELGGFDEMLYGNRTINLANKLKWTNKSNFYYRLYMDSYNTDSPVFDSVELVYDHPILENFTQSSSSGLNTIVGGETVYVNATSDDNINVNYITAKIAGKDASCIALGLNGGQYGYQCSVVVNAGEASGDVSFEMNYTDPTIPLETVYDVLDGSNPLYSTAGVLILNAPDNGDTVLIDQTVVDDEPLEPEVDPVPQSGNNKTIYVHNGSRTLTSFEVDFDIGGVIDWADNYSIDQSPDENTIVAHYSAGDFTDIPGVSDVNYTMYIPRVSGQIGVRICPSVESYSEVTPTCENGYNLLNGETRNGLSLSKGIDPLYSNHQVWIVTGLTNTGGKGIYETGANDFTLTPDNSDAGETVEVMMEYTTASAFETGDVIEVVWENDPGMTLDFCDTPTTDVDGDGKVDGGADIDNVDKSYTYTLTGETTQTSISMCVEVTYQNQGSYSVILNDSNSVYSIALFHVDDSNLVNVIAHIEPTLSFNIRNWGDTADTNVCDLGVVSTQTQPDGEVDGFTSGECGYGLAVGTNAEDGFIVSVNSDRKLSNGVYEIADVGASFTAGTEAYGYYGFIGGEDRDDHNGTGDVLPGAFFDNLEDDPFEPKEVPDTEEIFALYTDPFVYTRDSGNADLTRVIHAMTVSPATPAGTYTHQVTYTVVANY